jgi:SAM-dependent methyltransferase
MSALPYNKYLSGEQLYGNDFSEEQILQWFEEEKEGYYGLISNESLAYSYGYHALNVRHGFRHLPKKDSMSVLGIGSAFGDEFLPIIDRIGELVIVEATGKFKGNKIGELPCRYVMADPLGKLDVDSGSCDLITCFSALHHVPNVSFVLGELYRCLKSGGHLLLREPIVSLGDWTKPRPGLTRNERGIPLFFFREELPKIGFDIQRETLCMFSASLLVAGEGKRLKFNTTLMVAIDEFLSRLFKWNINYFPEHIFQKVKPTAVYYVLSKTASS